jgi:hypothetical protein
MTRFQMSGVLMTMLICLSVSDLARAADTASVQFARIDTGGKNDSYLEALKPLLARMKELVELPASVRIFRAEFAGDESGLIYIFREWSDSKRMAQQRSREVADDVYSQHIADLVATGRKLLSNSLLRDRTPLTPKTRVTNSSEADSKPRVMEWFTVDTKGKTAEYLKAIEPVIRRSYEVAPGAEIRIYQAEFAGESVGTLYVAREYKDMETMARQQARLQLDTQYQEGVKSLAAMGRVLVSRSLLVEQKP